MAYQLRIKPSAEKELNNLPKKDYYRALAAFSVIAGDPYAGKKLEGKRAGQYSMRIWPYRIIYSIYKTELLIVVISIG
ncbi:MAG TPA: type II toxin-antitoxin system RelE/ParE family toxin [Candidatus Paceibacterota bacterium]|nr:type II toxin-antitoxin system RelE/ParE family toxin [Candidatus Pacearchaeota archaeon]HRZ51236.1 type II toxin-antitoxin system RelE/ParE family toxin [Candidatus Paceibacterota bacterium]HSA36958.1 type II toxin-antitoxin system RelE/ParE family toxin [Candidatus Paceibacterota bacterium]